MFFSYQWGTDRWHVSFRAPPMKTLGTAGVSKCCFLKDGFLSCIHFKPEGHQTMSSLAAIVLLLTVIFATMEVSCLYHFPRICCGESHLFSSWHKKTWFHWINANWQVNNGKVCKLCGYYHITTLIEYTGREKKKLQSPFGNYYW